MGRDTKKRLPFAVEVALVEAAGKCLWYWADFRHFLSSCGAPEHTVSRLANGDVNKFEVMRRLLALLKNDGRSGQRAQEAMVRGLMTLPLKEASGFDLARAREAQAELRRVVGQTDALDPTAAERADAAEVAAAEVRRADARRRRQRRDEAERKRSGLFDEYCALLQDSSAKQGRGYRLEEMIGEVAGLDGMRYAPAFRKSTVTQTDGMITHEGFQYLIEARWRTAPADVPSLAVLAHKASRNLQSTRGLFLSVEGFRDEVVREIETGMKNVLLMSGKSSP